jgi:hypothetical protein
MRSSFALLALAGSFLIGCASDEEVICERLAECDLLVDGLTEPKCEDDAARQVSQDRLEKCADCVEDKPCKEVLDGCRNVCEPGE